MKLSPLSPTAIRAFVESQAKENLFEGAVRSSKTWTGLLRWAAYVAFEAPPGLLLMAGRTQDSLRDNCLFELERIVGNNNFKWNSKRGKLYGRDIVFTGGGDVNTAKTIQGITLAGAYENEAVLLHEDFRHQLGLRLSVPGAKRFLECNPGNPNHEIHKKMQAATAGKFRPDQFQQFHFTLQDNLSLTKDYLELLELEYVGMWYERFILGRWVAADGAIYPFFDKGTHLIKRLPALPDHIDISVDVGAANATSAGFYGSWDRSDKTGLIAARFGGYYHSNRETREGKIERDYINEILASLTAHLTGCAFSDALEQLKQDSFLKLEPKFGRALQKAFKRVRFVLVDPAAKNFRLEFRQRLEALQLGHVTVRNARNDVLAGIQTHSRLLKGGGFKLLDTPSNKPAIDSYDNYIWDKTAQDNGLDEPDKTNDADHPQDDIRYYLHTLHRRVFRTGDPP